MPRNLKILIAALAISFVAGPVSADNIGVGKPGTNNELTTQTTTATTDDNIGVGQESWYDTLVSWFELSGS